jgi:hypothetical protein
MIGGDTLANRELAQEQNYGHGWAMGHKERQSRWPPLPRSLLFVPAAHRDLTDDLFIREASTNDGKPFKTRSRACSARRSGKCTHYIRPPRHVPSPRQAIFRDCPHHTSTVCATRRFPRSASAQKTSPRS